VRVHVVRVQVQQVFHDQEACRDFPREEKTLLMQGVRLCRSVFNHIVLPYVVFVDPNPDPDCIKLYRYEVVGIITNFDF
jgi:hypothetical protein